MPALAADAAAAARDGVTVTSSDGAILSRYPTARDGLVSPAGGFCDDVADAQALADARRAIIGVERRRFAVDLAGLWFPDLGTAFPTARLTDAEQAVDGNGIMSRCEIDLDSETVQVELLL